MYECTNGTLYMCEEHGSNQPINQSLTMEVHMLLQMEIAHLLARPEDDLP
jgi:hypothetical protein